MKPLPTPLTADTKLARWLMHLRECVAERTPLANPNSKLVTSFAGTAQIPNATQAGGGASNNDPPVWQ